MLEKTVFVKLLILKIIFQSLSVWINSSIIGFERIKWWFTGKPNLSLFLMLKKAYFTLLSNTGAIILLGVLLRLLIIPFTMGWDFLAITRLSDQLLHSNLSSVYHDPLAIYPPLVFLTRAAFMKLQQLFLTNDFFTFIQSDTLAMLTSPYIFRFALYTISAFTNVDELPLFFLYCFYTLIPIFVFSDFNIQWAYWLIPFILFYQIKMGKITLEIFFLFLSYFAIILLSQGALHIGLLSPLEPALWTFDRPLDQIIGKNVFFYIYTLHTLFAASLIFIGYRLNKYASP